MQSASAGMSGVCQWAAANPQLSTAIAVFLLLVVGLLIIQPPFVRTTVNDNDDGLPVQRLDFTMVAWLAAGGTLLWWVWPHLAAAAENWWNTQA